MSFDIFLPTKANFKCAPFSSILESDGVAQDFGFGFPLEGNFTFTWMLAVRMHKLIMILICFHS